MALLIGLALPRLFPKRMRISYRSTRREFLDQRTRGRKNYHHKRVEIDQNSLTHLNVKHRCALMPVGYRLVRVANSE